VLEIWNFIVPENLLLAIYAEVKQMYHCDRLCFTEINDKPVFRNVLNKQPTNFLIVYQKSVTQQPKRKLHDRPGSAKRSLFA
jgi:hypothetical protein